MAWTDERLEERFHTFDVRFDGVDRRFEEVDRRFDEVDKRFDEVSHRFDRVEGKIVDQGLEMRAGFAALQSILNRVGVGIILSLMGVIATILAKGT
jgi:hypothetical protein